MWTVHNECSTKLNHMDISNHGSDEMMVVRTELLNPLAGGSGKRWCVHLWQSEAKRIFDQILQRGRGTRSMFRRGRLI